MKNHLFCFGLGYTALEIISQLAHNMNWEFSGTKRTISTYMDSNIKLYEFDSINLIPRNITHMLISIPPKDNGDIAYNQFQYQIKKLPYLRWIGYFSTTSVYGDHQGEWVNELSATKTTNTRSLLRLKAEIQWLSLNMVNSINIFRLPAIYGPYRSELEKILSGKAQIIIKPNQFFSRIHVSDIAQIVILAMGAESSREIYNLSDDCPSSQADVTEYAYKLLNLTPPEAMNFAEAQLSEMIKSYYLESKKISNKKVKEAFGISLKYPSYKEGLNSIFKNLYSSRHY